MSEEDTKRLSDFKALLEVARSLTAEKDPDNLLGLIMQKSTEAMNAERSSLFLYDSVRDILYTHITMGKKKESIKVPMGVGVVGKAAVERKIVNVPDVSKEPSFNPEVDRKTGFVTRNLLTSPLISHENKLMGVIQVLNKRSGSFSSYDEELVEAFSRLAAVSLDSAHLVDEYLEKKKLENSLQIARQIQRGLFPKQLPRLEKVELAAWCAPCEYAGGDYYDLFMPGENNLILVVADVAGHGIGPALLMSETRALFRSSFLHPTDIYQTLTNTNSFLCEDTGEGRFVTAFVAHIDLEEGKLSYGDAGHGHILFRRQSNGSFEEFSTTSFPLGITSELQMEEAREMKLEVGDLLVLYTDGLTETRNTDGEMFSSERLKELINTGCDLPLDKLLASIKEAHQTYADGIPLTDDVTVVLARWRG